MVRLRLSASRYARASAAAVAACGCCLRCRHAGGRPRLRPALRAAAAALALSLRRRGGGRAVLRRLRPVRAPRAGTQRAAPKSTCSPRRSGARSAIRPSSWRCGSPCSACSSVTILAGLLGDQNPYRNIAPTLVWIVWWVGLAYVAAFVGDIWALVNPWRTIFDGAQWLYRRLGGHGELRRPPALPASAGRLARLRAAAGLLLDRARLPERGRPGAHRRPGHRLFRAHLGRHARLRPRRLAAARRGLLAGVRHLRPLRADRSGRAAGCCCARSAAACSRAGRSRRR